MSQQASSLLKVGNTELREGEYFLHVLVEETMCLFSVDGSTVNPTVKVSAFESRKSSTSKKDISPSTNCYWGDHFHFSKSFSPSEDIRQHTVEIAVYDYRKLLRDSLIGNIAVSLSHLYYQPEHTIKNRWFVLQNKDKDFQQIYGYIKLSLNLASASDERVDTQADEDKSATRELRETN